MAKYSEWYDNTPTPKDPLTVACATVLKRAERTLRAMFEDLEKEIGVVGQQLDTLRKARDVIGDALQSTERMRVEIQENQKQGGISEDAKAAGL